jgi:hypothetical protein
MKLLTEHWKPDAEGKGPEIAILRGRASDSYLVAALKEWLALPKITSVLLLRKEVRLRGFGVSSVCDRCRSTS